MYDIIHQTDLKPGKSFIDLGCGVGNCLIQASLAAGCDSFGVEMQKAPSVLGDLQVAEAQKRWKLFGLTGGMVEAKQADFLKDPELPARLAKADVVLVVRASLSAASDLMPVAEQLCLLGRHQPVAPRALPRAAGRRARRVP
jgi:H3 lysine-79-specific histone-lysine N-methyltransferase